MAIFGPKPWVNPFAKNTIFRLLELFVCITQKRAFSFQIIVKVIFLTNITLKKRVGKMAIFGPKPSVNPFAKMSIFRLLELFVSIAQKGAFSFQIIVKVTFLNNIALKKKVGKMAIFGPNPWVKPFGKMSIFRLFGTSCYFCLERRSFNLEYRKSHFPNLQCRKKKCWKNGHIWTKTMG